MILQKNPMYYVNVMITQVKLASACSEFVCLCVTDVCLGIDECEYLHTHLEVRGPPCCWFSPSTLFEMRSPFCLSLHFHWPVSFLQFSCLCTSHRSKAGNIAPHCHVHLHSHCHVHHHTATSTSTLPRPPLHCHIHLHTVTLVLEV